MPLHLLLEAEDRHAPAALVARDASDARFSPAFGDRGAENLFTVSVGYTNEQAANFLAA